MLAFFLFLFRYITLNMSAVTKGGKNLFQLLRTLPNEGVGSRIVSLVFGGEEGWGFGSMICVIFKRD